MSSQNVLLKSAGLYSFPNHLSSVPNGALLLAKNIVLNRDSIAESRRGFKLYGTAMDSTNSDTAHQLLNYKGRILRHWGTNAGQFLDVDGDGTGTFDIFSITLTGTLNSTTTVSALTDGTSTNPGTTVLEVGMFVIGIGIVNNTTIASITDTGSIVLSVPATSTNTGVVLNFIPSIQEVQQGLRIKGVEQNGNFYFTTSEGIRKLSANSANSLSSAQIVQAGAPKALDVTATITQPQSSHPGWFQPQSTAAYRVVWGIKDANNNLILGAPSGREVINNIDLVNSATVDLKITIPKNITPSYFFQVYRTISQTYAVSFPIIGDTNTSTTITNVLDTTGLVPGMLVGGNGIPTGTSIVAVPAGGTSFTMSAAATSSNVQINIVVTTQASADISGDEEGLVYESNPLLSDINNGYVSITDITSNDLVGANLYTNASSGDGQGILGANNPPPLATDITTFKGYTFYSNTKSLQNLNLSLLSVLNFVADTSSITITDGTTSNTYTFSATEDAATKKVFFNPLLDPGTAVGETARSLIRVINSQDNEIVYAYYLSSTTSLPGQIFLEARNLNQQPFYITSDTAPTGAEFNPSIPVSGNSVISSNDILPNRIFYSKYQQPESVPIVNFLDVGPQDSSIVRIVALRDNLFVLKQEGIYRITGLSAPFSLYPFDFSTIIRSADSAVVLNNLIYLMSNQGVATISDTGVSVISRPIEDQLLNLLTPLYPNFNTATFGVTYESDRAYYLFTVLNKQDIFATQCFRFNTFTNTWTILELNKRSGIVNSFDDVLYLSPIDVNFIEQERKSFDRTDFADREISQTLGVGEINGVNIFLSSLTNISVGDVIVQVQNLTNNQFNQLLTKLDRDSVLSDGNYFSTSQAVAGINLSDHLDVVIAKIRDDSGRLATSGATSSSSYTALIGTGSSSFAALQSAFNNLIALLNADVGVGYKNYISSNNTISYELPILTTNLSNNLITTNYSYPLIAGPITIYNHISTDLQFVPQYFGDVSMTKHASEGTFIFEDASFTSAIVLYSSDLSANFESITINGSGNGTFGNSVFGNGVFGGNGSGVPFRTYIPKDKQRNRYLNCRFQHNIAREIFSFYGISLTFNPVSSRGWR